MSEKLNRDLIEQFRKIAHDVRLTPVYQMKEDENHGDMSYSFYEERLRFSDTISRADTEKFIDNMLG